MDVIQCDLARHGRAILAIFNDAIVNSTALYDYKPRTMEHMATWFEVKAKGKYPVIGIENSDGELMAFGSYGTFRAHPAYKYSVEHSVYVDARFRRQGIGRRVMQEIITAAQGQDYHVLIGAIDASTPQVLVAGTEYYGFRLALKKDKSTGAGSCAARMRCRSCRRAWAGSCGPRRRFVRRRLCGRRLAADGRCPR